MVRRRINSILHIVLTFLLINILSAQNLVINEVMSSNSNTLIDEDEDTPDWIELYNSSNEAVDIAGYGLSDEKMSSWIMPSTILGSGNFLIINASGKNRADPPLYWETIIDVGDLWSYIVPESEQSSTWRDVSFDADNWLIGKSGFGYGDNDDSTIVSEVMSVFIRKEFELNNINDIGKVILDIDFDDGFVAYLNGIEIARDNIAGNTPPAFDTPADDFDHEAMMYEGGMPNRYESENLAGILNTGKNVLAIQVHNHSIGSSDLTCIPFLSLGYRTNGTYVISPYLSLQSKGGLHTDFKISAEGETIYLTSPEGKTIDSLVLSPMGRDVSFGRVPDGGEAYSYFNPATPNASNGDQVFSSDVAELRFSKEAGIYDSGFMLVLSSVDDENLSIYYTLDGSDPDVDGQLYETPIEVSTTAGIRAIIVDPSRLKGTIQSRSYLINTDHKDLPIISLMTDPDNLWDYNKGIYVLGPNAEENRPFFGANFWQDREIPIHVELFEQNSAGGFSINAGAKIFGGWSRANEQRSLALHFRNSYEGALEYPIFPSLDINTFHSFVLRNSGNDWNSSMFRDGFMNTLMSDDVDQLAFRPSVVYLNGEYWGILNIREKLNEDYIAAHHSVNAEDVQLLEANNVVLEGENDHYLSLLDFITNNDLSVDSNYDYVRQQMDVNNFIRYQVGNIFIDNTDWPGNNIKYWRENTTTGRWKWITYDKDFGFNMYNDGIERNTLSFALTADGPYWPNPPWSTLLLRQLMVNESFKHDFINFFADELNSTYLSSSLIEDIDKQTTKIEVEIGRHLNRWNADLWGWNNAIQSMKYFANQRSAYVWTHIASQFGVAKRSLTIVNANNLAGDVRVNNVTVNQSNWLGYYFQDVPIRISAIPNKGYQFVRWEGDLESTNDDLMVDLKASTTIRPIFEITSDVVELVINEINAKSTDDFNTDDWVELANISEINADISGWSIQDAKSENEFVFPANTVIKRGGYIIIAKNKERFSALNRDVSAFTGNFDFGLSGESDCVKLFDDEGNLHDEVCYTNISPWPVSANDANYTIALLESRLDNSNSENWVAVAYTGTPGLQNFRNVLHGEDIHPIFRFYPNPTFDKVALSFHNQQAGMVNVYLFDLAGKQISHLYEEKLSSGNYTIVLDLAEFEPSLYFLKMINNQQSSVLKLIIQ
jgi:hypothetical protein